MNDLLRGKALEALEIAVRQNEHDMLMTGDELRQCREALTSLRAAAPVVQQGVTDEQIDNVWFKHANPAPVRMLTRDEVDEIVYQCRQDGDDTTYAIVHAALVSAIGAAPSAQPVRMLTRAEIHAALPAPTSTHREFKGMVCVQMTWTHFNEWATAIQRKFCEVNGLKVGAAPAGVPADLISAADAHADMYEGSEIPARDVRAAITNAFYAGASYAAPAGVPLSDAPQEQKQMAVLDALQVLQRVGSDTSEVVNAGDFLRRMGEAGLWIIANPTCEVRADCQAAGAQVQQDWTPTAENVNALPEPLRRYVHELESLCDPAGIVRENVILKDCNLGLQAMYRRAADAQAMRDAKPVALSAADAAFLAARLRRLFKHFDYPLPAFAQDDASLIGIAGSAIGAVLAASTAAPAPAGAEAQQDAPATPSGVHVGDTRFEGWYANSGIGGVKSANGLMHNKQDMRDAYAAGHEEGWQSALSGVAAPAGASKILRTGSTLYELNAMGYNRWSALVQPGHDDNDKRISESECERIAAALSGALAAAEPPLHPNHLPDLRYALDALKLAREAIEPLTEAQIKFHRIKRDTDERIEAAIVGMRYIIKRTEEAAHGIGSLGAKEDGQHG